MGEEVPAHSGLLDVARQDLGGLVRAGEKMEENVPRSKRAMPRERGRVRLAAVSRATCVRGRAEGTAGRPCSSPADGQPCTRWPRQATVSSLALRPRRAASLLPAQGRGPTSSPGRPAEN